MITNYEHYKDAFIKDAIFKGMRIAVTKNGEPVFCNSISCHQCNFFNEDCTRSRREWLNAEYKEPVIEINWEEVPVDTKILVKCQETDDWLHRHFAEYKNGIVYTFELGTTSWSVGNGQTLSWDYAKLANPEDIEKYRKR